MEHHEKYISRCIDLAMIGLGRTSPNPLVGCVIVHQDNIIGEGFHSRLGGPHAEVVAINSVKEKKLLPLSTLYVNLEPCNHHGKTPPCTILIKNSKIRNVVVGTIDPNPIVGGKGIKKLQEEGCNVIVGILDVQCKRLNKRFFHYHQHKKPFVTLKWAQSADGFIDHKRPYTSPPAMITSEKLRVLVHKWRSQEQAILVGTNTAIADNPKLNVRDWHGIQPLRIVIDRNLKIPQSHNLLDNQIETLVVNEKLSGYDNQTKFVALPFIDNLLDLDSLLDYLYQNNILSVLVEGGAKLLQAIIDQNKWNEARVFVGNQLFKNGVKAPMLNSNAHERFLFGTEKIFVFHNNLVVNTL